MSVHTPRTSILSQLAKFPLLALLALVLLPVTTLSLAGPARADDGGRTSTTSVAVANPSFLQGTRHWRAYGPGARLNASRTGHRDAHSLALLSPRNRSAGLRQVGTSAPLTASHGRIVASVWLWSRTSRQVIVSVRSPRGATVAHASTRLQARRWQRVGLTHRVTGFHGTRLGLDVMAGRTQRAGRLLVDDVSLRLVRILAQLPATGSGSTGTWMSGASGDGVPNGDFGRWRGSPVPIAGTWNDTYEAQINEWSVQPGMEYGAWDGDVDNAIGAIYDDRGETWAKAAAGAYDARWRATLTTLKNDWAGHTGTMYIRFAHEFNGDWYGWKVSGAQTADFKTAWRRFRALQQDVFPASKLVFCPSATTQASNHLDWRDAFPGKKYVDVLSVDWYNNQWGFIKDGASFHSRLPQIDHAGAPVGLDAYRLFAKAQGLPFAVSEWSTDGSADGGDSPAFVKSFHDWVASHAGTGPGEVLYEILFNVNSYQDAKFALYPSAKQPLASAAYQLNW